MENDRFKGWSGSFQEKFSSHSFSQRRVHVHSSAPAPRPGVWIGRKQLKAMSVLICGRSVKSLRSWGAAGSGLLLGCFCHVRKVPVLTINRPTLRNRPPTRSNVGVPGGGADKITLCPKGVDYKQWIWQIFTNISKVFVCVFGFFRPGCFLNIFHRIGPDQVQVFGITVCVCMRVCDRLWRRHYVNERAQNWSSVFLG